MTAVNTADTDFPLLNLRRVAGNIGAEIRDIRLSAELDAETFAQLDAALVKYKVLFFRQQSHLTDAEHQAFGKMALQSCRPPDGPFPGRHQIV